MSDENSDEEKIEKQVKEQKEKTVTVVSEEKPKQKREYVMTEARKAALERCRVGRLQKGATSKAKKEQAKELVNKIMKEETPLEPKEEPEQVVVKKTKKKTKQVIVFESDSESDEEENQIIIRRKRSKAKKEPEPPKPEEPAPIFRLRRL